MLDSEATLPRAERLLTHRLLDSVLPHPLIRPDSNDSCVESDETDDATVVEHVEDDCMANFVQSNSYCSAAAFGEEFVGKDSGGVRRLQLEPLESFISCCNRKDMSREFIVAECNSFTFDIVGIVRLCCVEVKWNRFVTLALVKVK